MKTISITELKKHLSFYLQLSQTEDVCVTKYGKTISLLTNPDRPYLLLLDSLMGKYNPDNQKVDYDELLKEEIFKRHLN